MTGQELKDKLIAYGVKPSAVAEKLGVTPQALDSTFKASDVRSGTLERVAVVLGVDMSFFYPAKPVTETTTNVARTKAHNLHTGSGNITENAGSSDALTLALQQNAELIALLRAKEGL